jgi:hypothetical protein
MSLGNILEKWAWAFALSSPSDGGLEFWPRAPATRSRLTGVGAVAAAFGKSAVYLKFRTKKHWNVLGVSGGSATAGAPTSYPLHISP